MEKFEKFDPSVASWSRYAQQLLLFLKAGKVEDALKVPTILTVIGSATYELLCDLIAPEDPKDKSINQIFAVLGQHFNPVGNSRIERYRLRERFQENSETISEYAAALRKISVGCDLADKLDFTLAEQFIYGLKDSSLKKRLISEKNNISFAEVVSLAAAAEISDNKFQQIKSSDSRNIYSVRENKIANKSNYASPNVNKEKLKCKHCGANHLDKFCKFKSAICHHCKRIGHIKPICRLLHNNKKIFNRAHQLELSSDPIESVNEDQLIISTFKTINHIKETDPIILNLIVDGKHIDFEPDSDAAVSVFPLKIFKLHWQNTKLEKTKVILKAFNHLITPVGIKKVNVTFNDTHASNLELFITNDGSSALLGRAWFNSLGLNNKLFKDIAIIENNNCNGKLEKLLTQFDNLFSNELGLIKDFEATLSLKKNANPKFCKHRNVPFALIPKVEEELLKLQNQGILSPTKFSKWASPIVPILKKNGTLRICGDYRIGLNKNLEIDSYPLPVIDEMLTKINGAHIFSKLDLAQAYQQVAMEKKSSELLTINTHLGLFTVSRLPFGISPAPAIFQSIMDTILKRIDKNIVAVCYLDDILICSKDITTHLKDLKNIFENLQAAGIKLNKEKCEFIKSEVEYLGHVINKHGVIPNNKKIKAIMDAPTPDNVDRLRSFLGLLGYYRKFISNLSSKIPNLNDLLCKNKKWHWNNKCDKEFNLIKRELTSTKVLTHYDPDKELILACDASPYGVGAILSHRFPDNTEKPIMFASRTLSSSERKYSQLDREALAIIFGIKKFHKYIFGRKFTLYTDHQPLTHIFSQEKEIPTLAAARLQRWAIILTAYNYDIKYKASKDNSNVDALSRSPIVDIASKEEQIENIFTLDFEEDFTYTKEDIAIATAKDKQLMIILNYLKNGWPNNKKKDVTIQNFYLKKEQLSIKDDCLFWGLRVIIPSSLQNNILKELHRGHNGIIRMKLLARSIFWWHNIDKDIENISRSCRTCQLSQKDPPKATIHPWIMPSGPWIRIHTDVMGPYLNKLFLVTVDSFSKWPEIKILTQANSRNIMFALEEYFTRFGYPELLVSDNGTPFTSNDFESFCKNRGINHIKSAPLHPASNGQAERFVEIAKNFLSKNDHLNNNNLELEINKLLFSYRSTPHSTLKVSPSELFLGRRMRSRLQQINPLPIISHKSFKNKYIEGQRILTKNFSKIYKAKWIEATIIQILSPVTFLLKLDDDREVKRHFNQIRPCYLKPLITPNENNATHPAKSTAADFLLMHPLPPTNTETTPPHYYLRSHKVPNIT